MSAPTKTSAPSYRPPMARQDGSNRGDDQNHRPYYRDRQSSDNRSSGYNDNRSSGYRDNRSSGYNDNRSSGYRDNRSSGYNDNRSSGYRDSRPSGYRDRAQPTKFTPAPPMMSSSNDFPTLSTSSKDDFPTLGASSKSVPPKDDFPSLGVAPKSQDTKVHAWSGVVKTMASNYETERAQKAEQEAKLEATERRKREKKAQEEHMLALGCVSHAQKFTKHDYNCPDDEFDMESAETQTPLDDGSYLHDQSNPEADVVRVSNSEEDDDQ